MAALQKATGFQAAILLLPAEARGKLELASHFGLTPPKAATLRRKLAAARNSLGILSNLRRRKLPWVWSAPRGSQIAFPAASLVALPGYRCLLFLPLPGRQQMLGLLVLYKKQLWDQRLDSLAFYKEMAQLLGVGFENSRQFAAQKRRCLELEKAVGQQGAHEVRPSEKISVQTLEDTQFLHRLCETIKYSSSEERVYDIFLQQLSSRLRMRQAVIATWTGTLAMLRVRASLKPLPPGSVREAKVEYCPVAASEKPFLANDLERAPDCPCQWVQSKQGSLYCIPLLSEDTVIGILQVEAATRYWTERRKALLNQAAPLLAGAVRNVRMLAAIRQRSVVDHLTRLFNRGFFEEYLNKEILRSQRTGQSFGLLMVDVDHFKQINDTHGHAAGDAVLRNLGSQLRQRLRSSNLVARYGGDEFMVVLCDVNRERALLIAERLRQATRNLTWPEQSRNGVRVSASIGLALFPENGTTSAELCQAADQALYEAKRGGRNKVAIAQAAG
ncbi:MAG: sensor domain-containing diguanylate cyclase [Acidobacteria bacterium]|nr:sensor domain-containing diguanylate cyclase [Acidobacteriota bacterium]